jgi:hypothetical protein
MTNHTYRSLVQAAEAATAGEITEGQTIDVGGRKFALIDGGHFTDANKGGRCYHIDYCLGEGREAIERTADMRDRMAKR